MKGEASERPKTAPHSFYSKVNEVFRTFSHCSAAAVGSAWAFILAVAIVVTWAATGSTFHFSDTWQLVINTGTTIVTFLVVFLIQNTQNRDAKAFQLELDELIRAMKGARNKLVDLEELSDEDLATLEKEFRRLRQQSEETDTDVRETDQVSPGSTQASSN